MFVILPVDNGELSNFVFSMLNWFRNPKVHVMVFSVCSIYMFHCLKFKLNVKKNLLEILCQRYSNK